MIKNNKCLCNNCQEEIERGDVYTPRVSEALNLDLHFHTNRRPSGHYCFDRFWEGYVRRRMGEKTLPHEGNERPESQGAEGSLIEDIRYNTTAAGWGGRYYYGGLGGGLEPMQLEATPRPSRIGRFTGFRSFVDPCTEGVDPSGVTATCVDVQEDGELARAIRMSYQLVGDTPETQR